MQITKECAHVMREENLFVHEVVKTAPNRFECEFRIDGTHPYLYENPAIANHVSGTTLLDVSRQLLKAISHLFYDAPIANRFVIRGLQMDFTRWTKLQVPIRTIVELTPSKKTMCGHSCLTITGRMTCYQDGWQVAVISGEFTTFPLELEERLMGRQYRQPPRLVQATEL